ncbi:hypothetical protein ONE63_006603 [Megalurothrips usitatus]|uniref:Platelet-derived growth factor (PDGF) family profile domain-containing protein n=1 Tax=Megalurothrips usitatus TaxID=439358 RepID=A0AAV7XX49_9NEOP|nr:hypothetical protein ONE63_006603 [Megalurothrips usitatus]
MQHRGVVLLVVLALTSCGRPSAASSPGCGGAQGCPSGHSGRQSRDIVFPGDEPDVDPITKYWSPDLIEQLNNLETAEEVTRTFSNDSDIEPIVGARIFLPQHSAPGRGEARSPTVKRAVNAKCQPMAQVVTLRKPEDLNHMYWPHCVQLERCGGCCVNYHQHSCQPTVTELVPIRVDRYLLLPNGMKKIGEDTLYEEVHKKCKCQCIVKAEDCSVLQEYLPNECRCRCANSDERSKCLAQNNKLWDNLACRCQCKDIPENCTTGLSFDPNTCSCTAVAVPNRRHPDPTYKLGDGTRRRRWQNKTRIASTSPPLF